MSWVIVARWGREPDSRECLLQHITPDVDAVDGILKARMPWKSPPLGPGMAKSLVDSITASGGSARVVDTNPH